MTKVFISYGRSSEDIARKVRENLLAAGHEAWSDVELPPHRVYAEVIEEKLADAEAVLVLWTAASAHSQWVRAEAEFGRERGKLVQVSLDGTLPPMPFNQIQSAKLVGWTGERKNPEWLRVVHSIAQLAKRPADAPAMAVGSAPLSGAPQPGPGRKRWLAAGVGLAIVAIAAAALGLILARRGEAVRDEPARVAIMPFEVLSETPAARSFAGGLGDRILSKLNDNKVPVVARDDAMTLRGPDRAARVKAMGVGLVFNGAVQDDGKTIDVRVHIDDPVNHASLWTGGGKGPSDRAEALQKEIATTVAAVVACSTRALQPNGLKDPALLSRYLRVCDLFLHNDAMDTQSTFELLNNLRIITAKAPKFAPAHSDLAKFEAYLAPIAPTAEAGPMRKEAALEADRALVIEPRSPDAWLAREMLLPPTDWAGREAMLRRGLAVDPEWPHTNGFLAMLLQEMGRHREALSYADRAAAADLQIDWRSPAIFMHCGAGDTASQIDSLKAALADQPDDQDAASNLEFCSWMAGRFGEALGQEPAGTAAEPGNPALTVKRAAFKALYSHSPADSAEARRLALELGDQKASSVKTGIMALAQLGFLDDAFRMADRFNPGEPTSGARADFLFYPGMDAFRRDPRFMRLSARLKLAQVWLKSGVWPDFCATKGFPYDCKAEARRWIGP